MQQNVYSSSSSSFSFGVGKKNESPIERVARATEMAKSLLENKNELIQTCKNKNTPIYGAGVEGNACVICNKVNDVESHCILPDDKTNELAQQLLEKMKKRPAEKLFKIEESTKKNTRAYCIGVLSAIDSNGNIKYYAACSGESTGAFDEAFVEMKEIFDGRGFHPGRSSSTSDEVEVLGLGGRFKAKKALGCKNPPGYCAGPQLIQLAVVQGVTPINLTELRVSPNRDMGKIWESCPTCQETFHPILCGLKSRQTNLLKSLEYQRQELETEAKEKLNLETQKKQAHEEIKDSWLAAICENPNKDMIELIKKNEKWISISDYIAEYLVKKLKRGYKNDDLKSLLKLLRTKDPKSWESNIDNCFNIK